MTAVAKTKPIPVTKQMYEDAFIRHFKCKKDDYEFKHDSTGGYFKFKKGVYQVLSNADLRNYCEEMLTEVESAMHIPFRALMEIAEEVHLEEKFMYALMEEIKPVEVDMVMKALQLSKIYESAEMFWNAIQYYDDIELYGECVVAIVKVYEKKCCVEELMGFLADEHYGIEYLTQLKNGIFASVKLGDDDYTDDDNFLIFTVDDTLFDIVDENTSPKKTNKAC